LSDAFRGNAAFLHDLYHHDSGSHAESGLFGSEEADEEGAGSFVRIEDKYLVDKKSGPALLRMLETQLAPDYPVPGTSFTLIESLYLESPDCQVLRSHFGSAEERFKLRSRRYGNDGNWTDDTIFLELKRKRKRDGVCRKERFRIRPDEYQALLGGQLIEVTPELLAMNSDLKPKRLAKRVKRVNQLVQELGLTCQSRVTYRRKAYEKDGLRVTVDDSLGFENLRPLEHDLATNVLGEIHESTTWPKFAEARERVGECFLVEVKHSGQVPAWVTEFFAQVGASKVSFSKYCYSVVETLERT
jgi:hypothetical protein